MSAPSSTPPPPSVPGTAQSPAVGTTQAPMTPQSQQHNQGPPVQTPATSSTTTTSVGTPPTETFPTANTGTAAGASAGSAKTQSPNLLTEFEAAYSAMISTLTQEDSMLGNSAAEGEARGGQEEKIQHFMDVARNLENFFLQRRLLIHNHKPELILKEDSADLKTEIMKKDELIRRHYEKLTQWQSLLQDMHQGTGGGGAAAPGTSLGPGTGPGGPQAGQQMGIAGGHPGVGVGGIMMRGPMGQPGGPPPPGSMPIHGPGAPMQPSLGAPQGGFVPGNNYRMHQPMSSASGMPPMGQQMHDPLSYLEKTATSVGSNMPR